MALQMIDGDQGLAPGGERLGRRHAHHHPADQPGPARGGNPIQIAKPRPASRMARSDHGPDLQMAARGDLRHHAAIRPVFVQLRQDGLGQDAPVIALTSAAAVSSQLVSMPSMIMGAEIGTIHAQVKSGSK